MSFIIYNALNTGYSPAMAYDSAYNNEIKLNVNSLDNAIKECSRLQYVHDLNYEAVCGGDMTQEDFNNAPCYIANLYRIKKDGDLEKIDI